MDEITIWGLLLSGGVAVTVITLFEKILLALFQRYGKRKDSKLVTKADMKEFTGKIESSISKLEHVVRGQGRAQQVSMYDRIKHIATSYVMRGTISLSERADLIRMHTSYQQDLGANGDLDDLMKLVKKLPIEDQAKGTSDEKN